MAPSAVDIPLPSEGAVMRGAVITELMKPLEIRENIPVPTPDANQILVKVTASSLCMSDIAGWAGHVGAQLPFCGGHEPVGIVAKVGSAVSGFAKGDRVGFMPASATCGSCKECIRGCHRFCVQKKSVGFSGMYGGFSQFCLADPLSTAKIPDGLPDEIAAPLLCAGVTAYGALKKVALRQTAGTTINIIGSGGVGHLVIMFAKAMGFKVHAFDIDDDKMRLARESGADKVFNSTTINPEEVEKLPSTIVVAGVAAAYDLAFEITRISGVVIAIGFPKAPVPINILSMILREQSLIATNQGTKQELVECLELAAAHEITPIIHMRKLEQINEGFQEMVGNKVTGRLVYTDF